MIESEAQKASKIDDEGLSKKELAKLVSSLEDVLAKNQEKREQYPNEPMKYIESEESLADHLHEVQGLTAYPDRIEDAIDAGLI